MEASRGANNPKPIKSKSHFYSSYCQSDTAGLLSLPPRAVFLRASSRLCVSVYLSSLPLPHAPVRLSPALPSEAGTQHRQDLANGFGLPALDRSSVSVESRLPGAWIVLFVRSHAGPGLASSLPGLSMGTRSRRPLGSQHPAAPARPGQWDPARAPGCLLTSSPQHLDLPPSQPGRQECLLL